MKRCAKCKLPKPETDFPIRKDRRRPHSYCYSCQAKLMRSRRKAV